jgi:hypothetical protein
MDANGNGIFYINLYYFLSVFYIIQIKNLIKKNIYYKFKILINTSLKKIFIINLKFK